VKSRQSKALGELERRCEEEAEREMVCGPSPRVSESESEVQEKR